MLFVCFFRLGKAKDCGYRFNATADALRKFPGTPRPVQDLLQGFGNAIHGLSSCFDEGDLPCLRDALGKNGVAAVRATLSKTSGRMRKLLEKCLVEDEKNYQILNKFPSSKNIQAADHVTCDLFHQKANLFMEYMNGN